MLLLQIVSFRRWNAVCTTDTPFKASLVRNPSTGFVASRGWLEAFCLWFRPGSLWCTGNFWVHACSAPQGRLLVLCPVARMMLGRLHGLFTRVSGGFMNGGSSSYCVPSAMTRDLGPLDDLGGCSIRCRSGMYHRYAA